MNDVPRTVRDLPASHAWNEVRRGRPCDRRCRHGLVPTSPGGPGRATRQRRADDVGRRLARGRRALGAG
jgi:hypothetical protein